MEQAIKGGSKIKKQPILNLSLVLLIVTEIFLLIAFKPLDKLRDIFWALLPIIGIVVTLLFKIMDKNDDLVNRLNDLTKQVKHDCPFLGSTEQYLQYFREIFRELPNIPTDNYLVPEVIKRRLINMDNLLEAIHRKNFSETSAVEAIYLDFIRSLKVEQKTIAISSVGVKWWIYNTRLDEYWNLTKQRIKKKEIKQKRIFVVKNENERSELDRILQEHRNLEIPYAVVTEQYIDSKKRDIWRKDIITDGNTLLLLNVDRMGEVVIPRLEVIIADKKNEELINDYIKAFNAFWNCCQEDAENNHEMEKYFYDEKKYEMEKNKK